MKRASSNAILCVCATYIYGKWEWWMIAGLHISFPHHSFSQFSSQKGSERKQNRIPPLQAFSGPEKPSAACVIAAQLT